MWDTYSFNFQPWQLKTCRMSFCLPILVVISTLLILPPSRLESSCHEKPMSIPHIYTVLCGHHMISNVTFPHVFELYTNKCTTSNSVLWMSWCIQLKSLQKSQIWDNQNSKLGRVGTTPKLSEGKREPPHSLSNKWIQKFWMMKMRKWSSLYKATRGHWD